MFGRMIVNEKAAEAGQMVIDSSFAKTVLEQARQKFGFKSVELMLRAVGDLTAANLATYGGYAPVHHIRQWFNMALGIDPVDQTSVFNLIDAAPFADVNGERLSWFATSGRNLVAHVEATANSERTGITTKYREITPVKSKLLWEPTYEFLTQSIKADPTGAMLMVVMTMLYRNDAADLLWNGDTDSTDGTLALHNGLVKKMKDTTNYELINRVDTTYLTDYTTAGNSDHTISALDALWDEIMTVENGKMINVPGFTIFVPPVFLSHYKRALRDLGSKTLESGARRLQDGPALMTEDYNGIMVVGTPYMPTDFICAAPSKVFVWRYVEDLLIEHDRDINKQTHLFVASQRHNCDIKADKPVFCAYEA